MPGNQGPGRLTPDDSAVGRHSETSAPSPGENRRLEPPSTQPFWTLELSQTPQPVDWIVQILKRAAVRDRARRLFRGSNRLRRPRSPQPPK